MDKKSQIVVFLGASYDRKGRPYSVAELARVYNMTRFKMQKLLKYLVMDKRVNQILVGRRLYYSAGQDRKVVPEIRVITPKKEMLPVKKNIIQLFTNWVKSWSR